MIIYDNNNVQMTRANDRSVEPSMFFVIEKFARVM